MNGRAAEARHGCPRRIIDRSPERNDSEIHQEEDQHRCEPCVPHPVGAPHWPAPERAGQEAHQSERRADQLLNFLKSRKFQKDLIWTRPLLRILGRDLLLQKKNIRSDSSPYSLRSAWSYASCMS